MVPKLFIHDEYNTAIIENIVKDKFVVKQIKKKWKLMVGNQNPNLCYMIVY